MDTHTPSFDKARTQFLLNMKKSTQHDDGPRKLYYLPLQVLSKKLPELGFNFLFHDAMVCALGETSVDFEHHVDADIVRLYQYLFSYSAAADITPSAVSSTSPQSTYLSDTPSPSTFQWPLVDMAEYEFGVSAATLDMSCVVVLTGLPRLCEASSISRLETLLRDTILCHTVSEVLSVHLPLEPSQPSVHGPCLKGMAFVALKTEAEAMKACHALNRFPWLVRVPSVDTLLVELAKMGQPEEGSTPAIAWSIWQARLFTHYGSEHGDTIDTVSVSRPPPPKKHTGTGGHRTHKKRIHLQVPRKLKRGSAPSPVDKKKHRSDDHGYHHLDDIAGLTECLSRSQDGGFKVQANATHRAAPTAPRQSSFRNSTNSVHSDRNRRGTNHSHEDSSTMNLKYSGDYREADGDGPQGDRFQSLLSEATEILADVISKNPNSSSRSSGRKRDDISTRDGLSTGAPLAVIPHTASHLRHSTDTECIAVEGLHEREDTATETLEQWCSSPIADTEPIEGDSTGLALGSDVDNAPCHEAEKGSTAMSPYEEVVASLVYILTSARSGEHVLGSEDRSDDDLYHPDEVLNQLERRGRQRHNELWREMESALTAAMEGRDVVGVLRAQIRHNELVEHVLDNEMSRHLSSESGNASESNDGWSSPSEEEELVVLSGGRRSREGKRGRTSRRGVGNKNMNDKLKNKSFHLRDLSHLLEATLDQLNEYVFTVSPLVDSQREASHLQKETSCRQILILVSSVRSKVIAEFTNEVLRRNRTIMRSLSTKEVNEAELEKKLEDALGRVRDYAQIVSGLREKAQEMQETMGYHRAAAERVRVMERRLSDADFDRRAAIAESERIQALLRQQLAEQSREIAAARESVEAEKRRYNNAMQSARLTRHMDMSTSSIADVSIDESLRTIDSTFSASELARMSEERLYKAIAYTESLSSKIRTAQDEIKDRKIKELELKERERKESSTSEGSSCCICKDEPKSILLLPCRHLCLCASCSSLPAVSTCPMCRTAITDRLQVYA